jgi:hypothetical protein
VARKSRREAWQQPTARQPAQTSRCITLSGSEPMSLVTIVIVLIVVGVLLWLINTYIPMQGTMKSILNAVVIIVVVIWLLQAFGVLGSVGNVRIG